MYLSKIDNKPVNETDSVNKTKIIDNLTELCRAMSDVSSSETHTVVDYISSIILNASDSCQGNTLMIENESHQEKK